jgi:hypothetical protein
MDCSIHPSATQQRRVRRVDDGVYRQDRDVLSHNTDTRPRIHHCGLLTKVRIVLI